MSQLEDIMRELLSQLEKIESEKENGNESAECYENRKTDITQKIKACAEAIKENELIRIHRMQMMHYDG